MHLHTFLQVLSSRFVGLDNAPTSLMSVMMRLANVTDPKWLLKRMTRGSHHAHYAL